MIVLLIGSGIFFTLGCVVIIGLCIWRYLLGDRW